jgi:hypothetical protein
LDINLIAFVKKCKMKNRVGEGEMGRWGAEGESARAREGEEMRTLTTDN